MAYLESWNLVQYVRGSRRPGSCSTRRKKTTYRKFRVHKTIAQILEENPDTYDAPWMEENRPTRLIE